MVIEPVSECVAWVRAHPSCIVTYTDHVGDVARASVLNSIKDAPRAVVVAPRAMDFHLAASHKYVRVVRSRTDLFDVLGGALGRVVVSPEALTMWCDVDALKMLAKNNLDAFVHLAPQKIRKIGAQHTRMVMRLKGMSRRFIVCGRVLTNDPNDVYPVAKMFGIADGTRDRWVYDNAIIKRMAHYDVPIGWKPGAVERVQAAFEPHTFVLRGKHINGAIEDSSNG